MNTPDQPNPTPEDPNTLRTDLPPANTLHALQMEIGAWSRKNFGNQESKVTGNPLYSLAPLLGIVEELGELTHAVLKHHQGIRGMDDLDTYEAARDDAVADMLIYLCDFACREGFSIGAVLESTWSEEVGQRNWKDDPQEGISNDPGFTCEFCKGTQAGPSIRDGLSICTACGRHPTLR